MRSTGLVAIAGAALLAGCGGGSGGADSLGDGSLTLGITDAPVDGAESVVVTFTGVELFPQEGDPIDIDYDAPKSIDLLALDDGLRDTLLEDYPLEPGTYTQIRLKVTAEYDSVYDSYIVIDGAQHELRIPSGSSSGLKLHENFDIADGAELDLTVDFDLRKSVVYAPGQGYMLKPSLRLVATGESGTLAGTIAPGVFSELSGCSADPATGYGVYLWSGAGATGGELGSANEPLSTADVEVDESGNYAYTAAYLGPGQYTVAATCQMDQDEPETEEGVAFVGAADVTIEAGATASHDFL